MPKKAIYSISMMLFLTLFAFWGIYQMQPPDVVPMNAPKEQFSAERAMKHLTQIAAKPHPIGSKENLEVRDYIINEIKKIGMEPEIQKTEVTRERSSRYVVAATVENIIVRLPGKNDSKAILLMSHYDTVPNAFGATDDGSGNVAMLETLRALITLPKLDNSVIFLFTDGEEVGLMGAKAFADQHRWAKDIGLVLNLEGRGSSGQTLMFETSDDNGWLMEQFAKASPYPAANSLSYEIYKRMPNDTDFSIFKRNGIPGLNFSYIDDAYDYHTANDNIQNIDLRCIQHHGEYLLSLTQHFGNLNLNEIKSTNAVYFNTIGYGFASYSTAWVIPLIIVVTVCFIIVILLGFRVKKLTFSGILSGLIAFLINLALAPVIVACLFKIISKPFSGTDWWLLFYNQKPLLLAFTCLTIAISFLFYNIVIRGFKIWYTLFLTVAVLFLLIWSGWITWIYLLITIALSALSYFISRKKTSVWDLSFGGLLGWVFFMNVVSLLLPGGSYIVTWPLFFILIPYFVFYLSKASDALSTMNVILLGLFAIPVVLWYSGFTYLYFTAMGLNMLGLVMVLITIAIGLLIPHIYIITSYKRWLFPSILTCCGIIFLLISTVGVGFDDRYRQPSTLFYVADSDQNQTYWASHDSKIDDWLRNYLSNEPETCNFSDILPGARGKIRKSKAPNSGLSKPQIKVIQDDKNGQNRTLRLHIISERQAPGLSIFINPRANIVDAKINDFKISGFDATDNKNTEQWKQWNYYALPAEGIYITLQLNSLDPFEMKLVEYSYGVPELKDFSYKPRPKNKMPSPYTFSDMTLYFKTFIY